MNDLVKLLKRNARFSNEQLAAMLGTTPEDVAKQIEKLENDGIIKKKSTFVSKLIRIYGRTIGRTLASKDAR